MRGNKRLRAVMVLHGETAADIARLLGMHVQSIHYRIRGKIPWGADQIRAIADHYNLTPEQVYEIFMTDK